MIKINRDKVITLLNEANKALAVLKDYESSDNDKILNSYKELSVIKYHFIILVEASIDICSHISAKMFKQTAESYAHCFSILVENKIIDRALGDKLSAFAKFRNVLVHLYWKVDDTLVVEKLNELDVFDEFLEKIVKLIK